MVCGCPLTYFLNFQIKKSADSHYNNNSKEEIIDISQDIEQSEPLILHENTKTSKMQLKQLRNQKVYDQEHEDGRIEFEEVTIPRESSSSANSSCGSSDSNYSDDTNVLNKNKREQQNLHHQHTIKSSKVPYIAEEQNVLQNINLVQAMKAKFLQHD